MLKLLGILLLCITSFILGGWLGIRSLLSQLREKASGGEWILIKAIWERES